MTFQLPIMFILPWSLQILQKRVHLQCITIIYQSLPTKSLQLMRKDTTPSFVLLWHAMVKLFSLRWVLFLKPHSWLSTSKEQSKVLIQLCSEWCKYICFPFSIQCHYNHVNFDSLGVSKVECETHKRFCKQKLSAFMQYFQSSSLSNPVGSPTMMQAIISLHHRALISCIHARPNIKASSSIG